MEGYVSVIVRQGKAHIPTEAITDVGVYIMVDPVYTIGLDLNALAETMRLVLAKGNPQIPHPARDEINSLPQPLLKAAKAKNWKELTRGGMSYSVRWSKDEIALYFFEPDKKGYFKMDLARIIRFSPDTDMRTVAQAILDDVYSRPELQPKLSV